jgi:hypothetical protein
MQESQRASPHRWIENDEEPVNDCAASDSGAMSELPSDVAERERESRRASRS